MKNKSKIVAALLFAANLAFISCDDWTDVESIDIKQPNIEEQNPELYTKYLENLHQYKESNHKQIYAWFNNSEKSPFSLAHHLKSLPDSIDAVSLNYPDNLSDWEIKEISDIQAKKGIKVIYDIDFDSIKIAYNRQQKVAVLETEPVAKEFEDFLMDSLQTALKLSQKYKYDGVCIGYTGKESTHMTETEKNEYIQNEILFMGIINDWQSRNSDKIMSFKGKTQNLYEKKFLKEYDIIFALGTEATNKDMLTYEYSLATGEGVPENCVGIIVSTPSLDSSDKITGYLGSDLAIDKVAEWAAVPQGGQQVAGVGIYNVSNDYFYTDNDYKYTRKVIFTLNPSVK